MSKDLENVEIIDLSKGIKIEMVLVKGTTFVMGLEEQDIISWFAYDYNEDFSKRHRRYEVTIERDYFMSIYPITQAQWKAVMRFNPSLNKKNCFFKKVTKPNHPVENINWYDTQKFLNNLNNLIAEKENRNLVEKYRLPTSAEWQNAAQGANLSKGYKYIGSDYIDEVAWIKYNSNQQTQPVGKKKPNELGIYDMNGNVFEWCDNKVMLKFEGNEEESRVIRGGSCYESETCSYKGQEFFYDPKDKSQYIGFRIVRTK